MRWIATTLLALLAACASRPPAWTPAARLVAASCLPPTATAGAPWQLASGAGYTFCMPPGWTTADGHQWSGDHGTVTWSAGTPKPWPKLERPDQMVREVTGSVNVVGGTGGTMTTGAASVPTPPLPGENPSSCSTRRFTERVAGELVDFYDIDCGGRHATGAWWVTRGTYATGDAPDGETAERQLDAYRSLRFASEPAR